MNYNYKDAEPSLKVGEIYEAAEFKYKLNLYVGNSDERDLEKYPYITSEDRITELNIKGGDRHIAIANVITNAAEVMQVITGGFSADTVLRQIDKFIEKFGSGFVAHPFIPTEYADEWDRFTDRDEYIEWIATEDWNCAVAPLLQNYWLVKDENEDWGFELNPNGGNIVTKEHPWDYCLYIGLVDSVRKSGAVTARFVKPFTNQLVKPFTVNDNSLEAMFADYFGIDLDFD